VGEKVSFMACQLSPRTHMNVRFREAARECRRKKKEYVRCLENRVAVLESQNQALIGELRALKELYLPKNNQE
jgi:hypothetical protein